MNRFFFPFRPFTIPLLLALGACSSEVEELPAEEVPAPDVGAGKTDGVVPEFSDVAGYPAEEDIEQLRREGIAWGYVDGTFRPERALSRQEFALFLARSFTADIRVAGSAFPDVPVGGPYTQAISKASVGGFLSGRDDGTFGPTLPMSREQVLVALAAGLELPAGDRVDLHRSYFDEADISDWADEGVAAARDAGYLTHPLFRDARLYPQRAMTRGEFATVLRRAWESEEKELAGCVTSSGDAIAVGEVGHWSTEELSPGAAESHVLSNGSVVDYCGEPLAFDGGRRPCCCVEAQGETTSSLNACTGQGLAPVLTPDEEEEWGEQLVSTIDTYAMENGLGDVLVAGGGAGQQACIATWAVGGAVVGEAASTGCWTVGVVTAATGAGAVVATVCGIADATQLDAAIGALGGTATGLVACTFASEIPNVVDSGYRAINASIDRLGNPFRCGPEWARASLVCGIAFVTIGQALAVGDAAGAVASAAEEGMACVEEVQRLIECRRRTR